MSARTFKLIGAAGAAALTLGVVAGPAVAAGEFTGTTTYNCGNLVPATVTFAMNTPPATMAAGQTVKVPEKSDISLDAGTTTLAETALGWSKVSGSVAGPTSPHSGLQLTFPKTDLGNNGDGSTTAHAIGNALLRSTKVGTYTVKFGTFDATLQGYNADGSKHGDPVVFSDTASNAFGPACVNLDPSGTTTPQNAAPAAATVKVVKDKSSTATKASYSAKKHIATGTAKVKGHFGLAGTGKVKFTLKKGAKTVKSVTATLKKGSARAAFKNVKAKGSYTITAAFKGDARLKGSSGKASFKGK